MGLCLRRWGVVYKQILKCQYSFSENLKKIARARPVHRGMREKRAGDSGRQGRTGRGDRVCGTTAPAIGVTVWRAGTHAGRCPARRLDTEPGLFQVCAFFDPGIDSLKTSQIEKVRAVK